MAIVRNDSIGTWSALIAWMQDNLVPKFFQSVEEDSQDNTIVVCTGVGGQKLFGLKKGADFYPSSCIYYKSDGTSEEIDYPGGTGTQATIFRWAAVCKNGALIKWAKAESNTSSSNSTIMILVTKNNNGKTAIVTTHSIQSSGTNAGAYMTTSVYALAEGDNPNLVPLTFTGRVMEQTQKVQFATNAASNEISYTPDAYYLQCGNIYDIPYNRFTDDGVTYLTNGYWAVRDE
jgi:hypothetical protein